MMRFLVAFASLLICAQAASTPVATSPIVTVIFSTSLITRSSVTGTSTSTIGGTGTGSCSSTVISGSTQSVCVGDAIALTLVTLYGTSVSASLTTITSTIGYSTIYSNVPDASTSNPTTPAPSPTQSSQPAATQTVSSSTITSVVVVNGSSSTSLITSAVTRSASGSTASSSGTAGAANSSSSSSSGDLSTGTKAAIAVAIILGVILGVVLAIFLFRRHQKKKKALAEATPDYSTGAAVGQHELYGNNTQDHAAIAVGAVNEKKAYETNGNAVYEAPGQDGRYYGNHGTQPQEMYAGPEYGTRYQMGPDRQLHEMDTTGRRY